MSVLLSKICLLGALLLPQALVAAPNPLNPQPLKDDVVLPLPCNLTMAFRKVYTSSGQEKLRDFSYLAGSAEGSGLSQALSQRYVQGGFHDGDGYFFYLGKYEVTDSQYRALMEGKCPGTDARGRLPVTNVSWFDAVEAARRLSAFWQANPQGVPSEGGLLAFSRLPTDDEWEFAARGGLAVSRAEFDDAHPPLAEGKALRDYAWYQGSASANGRLNAVGLLLPNPLGLHDLLGNAMEMVFDPFHATLMNRLHGLAGGLTLRGGSFMTPESRLASHLRLERPLYGKGGEQKNRDVGFRLALALPFAASGKELERLAGEAQALGAEGQRDGAMTPGHDEALAMLDEIMREREQGQEELRRSKSENEDLRETNERLKADNERLGSSLRRLRGEMLSANEERDAMRDSAIVSSLRLGGYLCSTMANVRQDADLSLKLLRTAEQLCKKYPDRKCQAGARQEKHDSDLETLRFLSSYYADHIAKTHETYALPLILRQLPKSRESLGAMGSNLSDFITLHAMHLKSYHKGAASSKDNQERWVKSCFEAAFGKRQASP
ncbi:MAG: SUMF1/EgtB/PvdO family nonheme iron enzyme [Succinivibrionaceae bacterium]|nr:SUMF1/EgtB/PvdO family nonheme iron enzyme [Succinivibrionaceae bacterium]